MLHISSCESGLKGGAPPTKKGEEKKKPLFNPMLYRLQEAKAKQQKEKDKKSEKEMKKKAAKETKERQAGDYREIRGPATANKSWEVTSQSSLGSSMVAERSEATEASSDVSSLNPPPPGFSYDTAYESGETEPQLSSLAVKPVVAQPTGKVSPGNSLNQSNHQQHPPHVQKYHQSQEFHQ